MEQQDGVVGTASFNAFNQLTGTTGIGTSANVLVAGKTINPANGQGEVSQVRVNRKPATMFADGSFQAWVPATTGAITSPEHKMGADHQEGLDAVSDWQSNEISRARSVG